MDKHRLVFAIGSFAAAFAAVMFIFVKKPHIVKSKNRCVRAFFLFALAFVPGVLAASICAKTITTVFDKAFSNETSVAEEAEEREIVEEKNEERGRDKLAS